MNKKNPLSSYLLLLIPITLLIIGQISTKYGSLLLNNASPETFFFWLNPYIAVGYSCLVLRGIIWVFILRRIELSLAYPLLSISFVIILIFSYYLFGEQISFQKVIGTFFIIGGVISIGFSNTQEKI